MRGSAENGLSADLNPSVSPTELGPSRWGAFGYAAFTVIWAASTVSNVGTAMFDTASGWLITSLNANPMTVSLVQVAVSLPLFLFTLPAGALADVIDSRRMLIGSEIAIIIVSAVFAALVSLGYATPIALLLTTFLLGVASALSGPAWLSITPLQVPRRELDSAIAANSVGFNLSRAVGPALGGLVIAAFGVSTPFWVFGVSNVGIIAALLWWRSPQKSTDSLPAERLTSAVRTGIRHAIYNRNLRATLARALAFYPFACTYWALLPLIARAQMVQGPELYGILLGALGAGAIAGSFALGWLKAKLGPDRTVALGTLATALALFLFGMAHHPAIAILACLVAGASWTVVLTNLYVSAQVALPDWVRGRGLAIFLTIVFGAMTAGSALWGEVAGLEGLPIAHFAAAAGALLAIPLTWGWKLQTGADLDLTPSMHWRAPVVTQKIENNDGPVLVTIAYQIDDKDRAAFLAALNELGYERKRDGAFAWGVFENTASTGRYVETFLIESWLELMHSYERVTKADRMLEEHIRGFLTAAPQINHLVASERRRRSRKGRARETARAPAKAA
jgi:predicted MFS family arabinose efflux permease